MLLKDSVKRPIETPIQIGGSDLRQCFIKKMTVTMSTTSKTMTTTSNKGTSC